jgi:diguanylate cyclase (GGDEF)-like protein/PAS domain S-box-containing protein
MSFLNRLSPVARLSAGLVALISLLLLLSHLLLGIFPDETALTQKSRQKLSESLAVQLASLVEREDRVTLSRTLQSVSRSGENIVSVGIRRADGTLLAEGGPHRASWKPPGSGRSNITHVIVPIFTAGEQWGRVEIQFTPLKRAGLLGLIDNPAIALLAIVSIPGLAVCYLYLRRALQYLDPSAVIPERVSEAFDSLSEAVMVLDDKSRIVLVNRAFRELHPQASEKPAGQFASKLPWLKDALPQDAAQHPWRVCIAEKRPVRAMEVNIGKGSEQEKKVLVNAAPVLDGRGRGRGALVTFDDVSELDRTNARLRSTLAQLEQSRRQIEAQNEELQNLALRDPLTGCLNRRAFMAQGSALFAQAQARGEDLCCVMADIDFFKSYNDQYGHAVGDQVIVAVARALQAKLGTQALLCRYGGEEFCMLLPDTEMDSAMQLSERMRLNVEAGAAGDISALRSRNVTSSFGVSSLYLEPGSLEQLIDQADQALYASKKGGRNRVSRYVSTDASVQV